MSGLLVLASLPVASLPAWAQRSTLVSPHAEAFGRFGWQVAPVGDVDADGTPDALVGAPMEGTEGFEDAGRAYVFSGSDGSVIHTLSSLTPEDDGEFGWSMAPAGDLTKDGVPDLLVGAPGEDAEEMEGSGRVYVLNGTDGTLIHRLASPAAVAGGSFGGSVASAGDVDGDATPDVLVGAALEATAEADSSGRVHVFSGSDGRLIHTLESPHGEAGGQFGASVDAVGDLDEDGVLDVLVGALGETVDNVEGSGRAYVFSGSDGRLIRTLTSPHAVEGGRFGAGVVGAGDVTGDNVADLLVSALIEDAGGLFRSGRVYLFSGSDGTLVRTLESPNRELDGLFGWSITTAGDVSGDGRPDVVVGAPFETAGGFSFSGRVYVFSGSDGALIHTLVSPNAEQLALFGRSIAAAGDVDGDATPDLLVGASDEDAVGFFDSGRTYVFSGRTGLVVPVEPLPSPNPARQLEAAFPNPFHVQTQLRLYVERSQQVRVLVYDLTGRQVARLYEGALVRGEHSFILHGAELPSGMYCVRAVGESFDTVRRVVLVR